MTSAFSGEFGEKKRVDSLASFDLSRLEYKQKAKQRGLHDDSGLIDSVADNVEVEYNGKLMNLESLKREALLDGDLVSESYEFRLKMDGHQVLESGLLIDFSPPGGGLPVVESVIKKSEAVGQKAEFKKLGVLFAEKLLIFLEDLARTRGLEMLSRAEYGPRVSEGKLSLEDWKKIFVPLLQKMGYAPNEEGNVWLKKLG